MTAPHASIALALPGDSGTGQRSLRALITDVVSAFLGALVRLLVGPSAVTVDRILTRVRHGAEHARATLPVADSAPSTVTGWSISQEHRTPIAFAVHARPRGGIHTHRDRVILASESPGRLSAASHETRNPDQREPARNAGRHHRGRPALRAAG